MVTVTVDATTITVVTPYDAGFIDAAKQIGGRWDSARKARVFDARDEQRVRALVREHFGTDGSDDDAPTVTVRLPVPTSASGAGRLGAEFRAAGRRLVWRPSRDSSVKLSDGVVVVSGGFPGWGGSTSNPRLSPEPDTVIEVRDVPAGAAALMLDEVDGAAIVGAPDGQRAALEAERAQLLARLAEIDTLLAAVAA